MNPKTVLITGASSGIGQACALRLDTLGFRVIAGVRKPADGETLKSQASERLAYVLLDVTDSQSIAAAAKTAADFVGNSGLYGLINNAGIVVAGPLEFISMADLREQMEINAISPIAVTQNCLPLLRKAAGRIVNIGSIAGRSSVPFSGPYCASKFALRALNDAMRLELRPWKIAVALIEPGAVATPIWKKSQESAQQRLEPQRTSIQEFYGAALSAFQEKAQEAAVHAIPVDFVVNSVVHALTARKPKTHYLIGKDTRQRIILELLPTRLKDWLVARALKIK